MLTKRGCDLKNSVNFETGSDINTFCRLVKHEHYWLTKEILCKNNFLLISTGKGIYMMIIIDRF